MGFLTSFRSDNTTVWMHHMNANELHEKKIDENYTGMLRTVLKKSWKQYPKKQQLYGHLPFILKTIQARRIRHVGHCWRSKDELVTDILLWTPALEFASDRWPARTYLHQLCADTRCSLEDLKWTITDRGGWRVREWGKSYSAQSDDDILLIKQTRLLIFVCVFMSMCMFVWLCGKYFQVHTHR